MIENPQPAWLPFLLLALPGIGLAAFALNQAMFPHDGRPLCTIPAIGIVLALLPTHGLALAFGSLTIGLTVAWSVVGAAGYAWIVSHWREFRTAISAEHAGCARRLGLAALATLPIVLPTILANFSDEANFNGHHAIIAHLQNGAYPPRYLYDPNLPLRYHYAFDLAGAIVTGLLRVRLDHAVDLLTLALWPCMFLLLWRVGEHVGGKRAGLFVALAVCFSGGWPVLAWAGSACGLCTVNGLRINPPFIHYFFQHPWSLGVPIFCLVVLQRAALPRLDNRAIGLLALICSLSVLSLAHAVLFITTVVALGLAEIRRLARRRDRSAAAVLLCLAASLLGAKLIGGFFVSGPFPPAGGFLDTGFNLRDFSGADAVLGQVQWNFASFGLLLVIGVIGLLRARHEKLFLAMLAVLAFTIVNLLSYRYSWDIVKFATVGFIALAIGAGIALSDLADWANRRGRRLIYCVLVIALAGQGVLDPLLLLFASYNPKGRLPFSMQMIRPYFSYLYPVNRDDAQAVSFLRTHMGPSEIVYRTEEKSEPYSIWGGLPTQVSVYTENGNDDPYGLGERRLAARKDLANISATWIDRLVAEHVTWVVTDDDDVAINSILQCPERRDRAMLAAQYGRVRVFRIR
jgi:hypothetical protein